MGLVDDVVKVRRILTKGARALRSRTPDETHAALVRRYFGDMTPGASMARFLEASGS